MAVKRVAASRVAIANPKKRKHKRKSAHRRSAAPRAMRRKRKSSATKAPHKRRKHRRSAMARHSNPKRRHIKRRRNPDSGGTSLKALAQEVMETAVGAGVAIGIGQAVTTFGLVDKLGIKNETVKAALPDALAAVVGAVALKYVKNPTVKRIAKHTLIAGTVLAVDKAVGKQIKDAVAKLKKPEGAASGYERMGNVLDTPWSGGAGYLSFDNAGQPTGYSPETGQPLSGYVSLY